MSTRIYVNGRSIREHSIGVSRYTSEILNYLDKRVKLLRPKGVLKLAKGIIWEQLFLPLELSENNILWSPANTGPIFANNQVVTIHDIIPIEHPEWFKTSFSLWYKLLLPRLTKSAKKVITDTKYSKDCIVRLLGIPVEKVIIIPAGVSDAFSPASDEQVKKTRAKYHLNDPYIFTIGSIEPRKNIVRMIKAWNLLSNSRSRMDLVIAGVTNKSSKEVDYLSTNAPIRMLGFVDEADLPALYTGAMTLAFPSIYEGFGLPVLEAMACGTPVIASNVTSLPEVVGEAGLLFNPFDVDEIADIMNRVISDENLREELKQKGFERARLFSWQKTAKGVWDVLYNLQAEIGGVG